MNISGFGSMSGAYNITTAAKSVEGSASEEASESAAQEASEGGGGVSLPYLGQNVDISV